MTIANSKLFTPKSKPVIYIGIFDELYNRRNSRQVYEVHGIIKFEKIYALIIENLPNSELIRSLIYH